MIIKDQQISAGLLQLLLYELKYINSFSLNITIINIPCQIIEKINIISKKCRRLDDKMLKYNYIKLIRGN